jgi:hypothetical protein
MISHTDSEPLMVARKRAFAMLDIGTTKGHELINTGRLDARKIGDKTVITMASIRALAESLPRVPVKGAA